MLRKQIMDHINAQTESILQAMLQKQPYPLLFATLSGAHLYGFPSPDSDYDVRGVHVLPVHETVGLDIGPDTLEKTMEDQGLELDVVTHDLIKFVRLLLRPNGYVLEQLYSPLVLHQTSEFLELKEMAQGCITRHHYYHYYGFANTQWNLFQKERPARIKPLLYVYRVLLTGIHLLQTGEVEANLIHLNEKYKSPFLDELIHRKQTEAENATLPETVVAKQEPDYVRLQKVLEQAYLDSRLPEKPTAHRALHDFLIRLRLQTR